MTIFFSGPGEPPTALRALVRDYPRMNVVRSGALATSTVIRDGTLGLRTLYPVLADSGEERPLRDERGWLVKGEQHVADLAAELPAIPEPSPHTPRRRRRRPRRPPGHGRPPA